MRGRLLFVAGIATGYVLGARAGRGAYNSLKERVQTASQSPQVQNALGKAKDLAEERAPKLTRVVTSVATGGSASDSAGSGGSDATSTKSGRTSGSKSSGTGSLSGLETGSTTGMDTGIVPGVDTDPLATSTSTLNESSTSLATETADLDESTTPTATY